MAKTLGVRLFTGYRLIDKWFADLDITLQQACDRIVDLKGDLSAAQFKDSLYEQFQYEPLMLGIPSSVTVSLLSQGLKTKDGTFVRRHLAAVSIPYSGSHHLLRTAPEAGFSFPYPGRPGKNVVKIVGLLADIDPTQFVEDVTRERDRVSEALHRSHPMVNELNNRLRDSIERKVRTY